MGSRVIDLFFGDACCRGMSGRASHLPPITRRAPSVGPHLIFWKGALGQKRKPQCSSLATSFKSKPAIKRGGARSSAATNARSTPETACVNTKASVCDRFARATATMSCAKAKNVAAAPSTLRKPRSCAERSANMRVAKARLALCRTSTAKALRDRAEDDGMPRRFSDRQSEAMGFLTTNFIAA